MIAAIVLAAGKSERMGQPKALLTYRGVTFLDRILLAIENSEISETIVVVGHNREEIASQVRLGVVVSNPDYESGMVTSLKVGIRALPDEASGAAIFLVDHPMIDEKTINALVSRFEPGVIIAPVYDGRRGHPVLFSRTVLYEILELPDTIGANAVVRRKPDRVIEVLVDEPGILLDIDTPEELKRFRLTQDDRC